jgi:solute carrier family 34 (sodium-dependent phosphate cotransporter)
MENSMSVNTTVEIDEKQEELSNIEQAVPLDAENGNSKDSVDKDLLDEFENATWDDVYTACCVHSADDWGWIFVGLLSSLFFLYWFMFSLGLLGTSTQVLAGCRAGSLFGDDLNPVAGVMIGIIATVLLDSSSATISIIVSLTGTVISLNQGIYMMMGANVGTVSKNNLDNRN